MQKNCKFENGIIAIIDLLGTGNVQENNIDAYEKDIGLFDLLSRTIGGPDYWLEHGDYSIESEYKFSPFMFSDTIIVTYVTDKTEKYLGLLAHQILRLVCSGIAKNRFYRGVINIGKLYVSENKPIVLGPAIKEASELYEQTNWFGISLCPTASEFLDNSNDDILKRFFVEYTDIPWKENTESHWVLNWPKFYSQNKYQNEMCTDFTPSYQKEILKEAIEKESDPEIKEKYQNSINFYEYTLKEE